MVTAMAMCGSEHSGKEVGKVNNEVGDLRTI